MSRKVNGVEQIRGSLGQINQGFGQFRNADNSSRISLRNFSDDEDDDGFGADFEQFKMNIQHNFRHLRQNGFPVRRENQLPQLGGGLPKRVAGSHRQGGVSPKLVNERPKQNIEQDNVKTFVRPKPGY